MAGRGKQPKADSGPLSSFGRSAGTGTLILSSLAEGSKHGWALTKDIESFANIRLAPGTLYEALNRLEGLRLIEPVPTEGRRRPYKMTALGANTLREHLARQKRVADLGLSRLRTNWGEA